MWNDDLEVALSEIKRMVFSDTLLNYPDWKIIFTVHIYASDKQLSAVISQNDKPIALFQIKSSHTHSSYTTTEKELLLIVEFLK